MDWPNDEPTDFQVAEIELRSLEAVNSLDFPQSELPLAFVAEYSRSDG